MRLLDRPIADVDPEIAMLLKLEKERQSAKLEMLASANVAPRAVLNALASSTHNDLVEGYPGRRYWHGSEYVDVIESLAVDRAKALFGAEHVNVQPHAGAQANAAAYMALLEPGDTILSMGLADGGHLSHGMHRNFSAHFYNAVAYHVRESDSLLDPDDVARLARACRPKLIVAGWSAYPRHLDFAAFRRIADEVGAYLLVDMAHFAGLVAAGVHPSPVPYADVVTSTTHKTLGGPRGGLILCRRELAQKIDSAVFPGQQSAPLTNCVAAKAVAFHIAAGAEFRERQRRSVEGAQIIADRLGRQDVARTGVRVLTGGTDVHLVLLDLRDSALSGLEAERRLYDLGIAVNRNVVPSDPRPPGVCSGLRIGTPAVTSRGFQADDFTEVAHVIAAALQPHLDESDTVINRDRITALAGKHPF